MGSTDNSYLSDKVSLRAGHLPSGEVRVLDCFGGNGRIWRGVQKVTGRKIKVLPVDYRDIGFHLPGDNRGYLPSLDLSRFNIIDLDAYGVPYDQLKEVFERGYQGIVFVTVIRSSMGMMPYGLLRDVGYTDEQIKQCPVVVSKNGWAYMLEWLANLGVRKIWLRSKDRKYYAGFVII